MGERMNEARIMTQTPRPATPDFLRSLFEAAADAARAEVCVPPHLPPRPKGRLIVVGAGKAAAAMARAVEEHYGADVEGLVVTRYGHDVPTRFIEVLQAGHPVPDQAGVDASRRILETVSDLRPDDLVLCLISGGGSALLSLPAEGLTLADKAALTNQLLRSGATISEINCVRKHLSAIKGGRLGVACHPARVVALSISDVPGDALTAIASGATVPDPTTYADARAVLDKYAIDAPRAVRDLLAAGADETPKPGDARFDHVENILVATPQMSLEAAARACERAGYAPVILSDRIEGESPCFRKCPLPESVKIGGLVSFGPVNRQFFFSQVKKRHRILLIWMILKIYGNTS